MLQTISPYELLCASKPKPAPTMTTAYDLYSRAHQDAAQLPTDETRTARMPSPPAAPDIPVPAFMPARRTHYICDIQSRHNAAIRRAPQQRQPLT